MSGSLNKVILVGNLGRDPEIRSTQDGQKIANLSLATSDTWKDRDTGERKARTEWHRVVIFNDKLSSVAEQYLRKGSKVCVEGQLQTRKWVDNGGVERYTTEIVLPKFRGEMTMLDSKSEGTGGGFPPPPASENDYNMSAPSLSNNASNASSSNKIEDDIPF